MERAVIRQAAEDLMSGKITIYQFVGKWVQYKVDTELEMAANK